MRLYQVGVRRAVKLAVGTHSELPLTDQVLLQVISESTSFTVAAHIPWNCDVSAGATSASSNTVRNTRFKNKAECIMSAHLSLHQKIDFLVDAFKTADK